MHRSIVEKAADADHESNTVPKNARRMLMALERMTSGRQSAPRFALVVVLNEKRLEVVGDKVTQAVGGRAPSPHLPCLAGPAAHR
jgi:hypothetical protein